VEQPGDRIITASWAGTAVFALIAALAAITGNRALEIVSAGVDVALFLAGCVIFLAAYARAVQRSRTEQIDVAGVYLMMGGSAPKPVRTQLLGSLAAQVVVALVTAAVRWPLAFGILVPTYGLGLAGLWAARNGTFPAKKTKATT
jgi:hypothetical protein